MKKPVASIQSPGQLTVLAALLAGLCAPALAASDLVISQVYAAGGNSGATYRKDFIELLNRGKTAISLNGMSVQYAAAAGPANGGNWTVHALPNKSVEPGQYFLIMEDQNNASVVGVVLPDADASGGLQMGGSAGKVLLSSSTAPVAGFNPSGGAILDLVGYGTTANGYEGTAPTPAPNATKSVVRAAAGCTDTDKNSVDFTAESVAPRNSASPLNTLCTSSGGGTVHQVIPVCSAPLVVAPGTAGFASQSASDVDGIVSDASITSTAVPGITLGALTRSGANGASASVDLNVAASTQPGTYSVQIGFSNADTPAQTASCTVGVTVQGTAAVTARIPMIQGTGPQSSMAGSVQTTEGVITMKFSGGYFIQDIGPEVAPEASRGILVFGATTEHVPGDLVRVTGTVTEYPAGGAVTYTELTGVGNSTAIKISGGHQVAPTTVDFPRYDLSRYQGMLVRFPSPLVINATSSLTGFGELTLSSKRRETPTNLFRAGSADAIALAAANAADQVVLTEASSIVPTASTLPYFDYTDKTVRIGDTVDGIIGAIDFANIGNGLYGYKVQPLTLPMVTHSNPRTAAPELRPGNVKVASANVLNFFTTFGNGHNILTGQMGTLGCDIGRGADLKTNRGNCRGADNLAEFERQRDKIVAELAAIDADVVGLVEIQNNGDLAVDYLVKQLNGLVGFDTYAYVPNAPDAGTDAIRVAMIYKPAKLSLVGNAMSDADPVNNRAPLAQTFKAPNGGKFSVIVNHLKSKGGCPEPADSDYAGNYDSGDGQACWNLARKNQALQLIDKFVPKVIAAANDTDVLIIGDLNAHGKEDPINLLTDYAAGVPVINQLERFVRNEKGTMVYSYVFGGLSAYLDHALATPSLDAQMVDATEWHNNADEPTFIDYNTEGNFSSLYVKNQYRAADHDPVVVTMNLAPVVTFTDVTSSFAVARTGFSVNRATNQFTGTITITNKTGAAINGPINIDMFGLPAGVVLSNRSGMHNGVPYITVNGGASIAPNASVTTSTSFANPNKAVINYTYTINSGTY
jgi:predicted extracellular nuclease